MGPCGEASDSAMRMTCRKPSSAKKSTRKSNSCGKGNCYQSDSTTESSSSCYSSDTSFTSSDSSDCSDCECYDCDSEPQRKRGKGKSKGRGGARSSKTSRSARAPCSAKTSKKKTVRRTKRSSSSCGCSDCGCSYSSDDDDCYGCVASKPRQNSSMTSVATGRVAGRFGKRKTLAVAMTHRLQLHRAQGADIISAEQRNIKNKERCLLRESIPFVALFSTRMKRARSDASRRKTFYAADNSTGEREPLGQICSSLSVVRLRGTPNRGPGVPKAKQQSNGSGVAAHRPPRR
ncbi:hypothetical protein WN55_06466 [Dufourea novaeangliae]|uniref:Uncharacterized protein n=1 Tax=Dufourea novaeangliae TaxID=178035 RepID=A0A154P0P6_DUFNO|nr:hypothetical protein WN55_06466 [Dufourea novaeangliae]